jgi:succinate dehydrogenase/fumarate reductase flavoprotein subunit
LKQGEVDIFDAVVIGSGYAGLVAIRDLATQANQGFVPRNLQVEELTELGTQERKR